MIVGSSDPPPNISRLKAWRKGPKLQLRLIHIAKSALSNWIATASALAVAYVMAPFLVQRLGIIEYGIWVLAVSTTAYLNLLDLGLRSSVLRFVSRAHSMNNHQEASEVVSAVLWVRLQIGALTLVLSTLICIVFPSVFRIPESLWSASRAALFIIGFSISVNLPLSALGAILSALNRYDLLSYINLIQLFIRAGGVFLVVQRGHGIVAMATCEFLATLVGNVLLVLVARRIYPDLNIRVASPERSILRLLWSYSSYSFILLISLQLIYQADNLVVGAFVSTSAVTAYSIGNSLCRYTQELFSALTNTFVPAASVIEASGSQTKLRTLYVNGTRATLALSLPVLVTLTIRGHSFIALWIGPQYAHSSGGVAGILAIGLIFSLVNSTASSIAFGTDKHKAIAVWTLLEGILNLTISVVLAQRIGMIGVAIGTLAPSLFVNLVLWPRYIPKLVEIRSSEVFTEIVGPMALSTLPFSLASLLVDIYFPPSNMAVFMLQTLLVLPTFYIAVIALFWSAMKGEILPRVKALISRAGGRSDSTQH
jgi:O-antigen/teichoic acid export membrane protein